jgi:hypothetical protein
LILTWARQARANAGDDQAEITAEMTRFARWVGLWLAAGLLLAAIHGGIAAQQFERSALGRARAATMAIDAELLARVLGPDFRITGWLDRPSKVSSANRFALVPALAGGALRPIELALSRVMDANPDVSSASVVTMRQGRLLQLCAPSRLPGPRVELTVLREQDPRDGVLWANRAAYFDEPDSRFIGEYAQAYAPIRGGDGQMLGWVLLTFRTVAWRAPQTQARLQAFGSVGLGLGLLGLFFQLRASTRTRTRQQLAVLSASASDQAKTAFLAKVSHELRTPIQSILGYGELIAQQPLAQETRRWLESLRSHGHLLTRLVNDLVDLSSLQAGGFRLHLTAGNLSALVSSAVDSLQVRAQAKGLRLTCTVESVLEGGRLYDPERVRQVLMNLLGNAIKFTARGTVAAKLRSDPADSGTIELRVTDTGPGILPEDQLRLFQPFSRIETDSPVEGAGLGLALSHALCSAMGGSLTVESDGTTGSTFIARWNFPPAPLPDPEAIPASASLKGQRVLVADDNTLVRELFVSCLRASGAECEAVNDGLAAVERITSERFDVVILDLSMPWLDGFEATRRLRRSPAAAIRIIGVSAHASPTDRAEALRAGMDAFLVKPVSLAELVRTVAAKDLPPVPPSSARLPSLEYLRTLFSREAPQLRAEIRAAAADGDRERLLSRIHYLRNSADIARFSALGLRCAQLESILRAGGEDEPRLLHEIESLLESIAGPG